MRSFWSHEQGRKPRFSLIIADRYGENGKDSDFLRTLKKRDEIAGSWTQLQLNYVQPKEFPRVLSTLLHRQLNIRFQADVDLDAEAIEAYRLTGGEWRQLADYIDALDVTLGGNIEQKRELGHSTLQQAKKRFRENTAHRPRSSIPMGVPNDFVALVSLLVTESLKARFDDRLDREVVAAQWFKATNGEWEILDQLVTCLKNVLYEDPHISEAARPQLTIDEAKLQDAYRRFNQQQQDAVAPA